MVKRFFLLSLAHRTVNNRVERSPLPVNEWLNNNCLLYLYYVFVVDDVSALNHCLKQLYFPVGLLFLVYDVARFFAECVFKFRGICLIVLYQIIFVCCVCTLCLSCVTSPVIIYNVVRCLYLFDNMMGEESFVTNAYLVLIHPEVAESRKIFVRRKD
jgi:hypothetical protein